jgi:arabinofuranosyltransferase
LGRATRHSDVVPALAPPAGSSSHELVRTSAIDLVRGNKLTTFLFFFFMWVLLKNSWLAEDAFITYRVADNFIHGLGLRWNPLDRVQVYTHPLWMFCISAVYFLTRDIYFAGNALCLLCSGLAVWLLFFRGLKAGVQRIIACVLLTFSKAFVDYSSGGLENPLSHLLLVLFFLEYLKTDEQRSFRKLVVYTGLVMLNRMDLVWLLTPPLTHLAWTGGYWRLRRLGAWVGLLPFAAWEVFSLVYYGFPFPNSAYVKLVTGITALKLLGQGGCYFINSIAWDPITLFAIAALVWMGIRHAKSDRRLLMISIGVALQLLYIAKIGGDYMSGRFFTAPLLASIFILSRLEFGGTTEVVGVVAVLLALGIYSPRPPIQTNEQYVGLGTALQHVDDERGFRHNDTSLLRLNKDHGLGDVGGWVGDGVRAKRSGAPVAVYANIGYYGYYAGPTVHVVDPYGIGDPLLARLPYDPSTGWSSGHFYRKVPEGYQQAAIGAGTIADPAIEAYWEKLELVTRGRLWDRARWREIVRFNLGLNPPPGG